MKIYYISGLAADERMFRNIDFPKKVTPVFIPWLLPLSYTETLDHYVSRIRAHINTAESFVLMGLSFGGMVCCELNKLVQPQKTIIISSVSSHVQFPPLFRVVKRFHLHQTVKAKMVKKAPARISNYLFGAATTDAAALLADSLLRSDPLLLDWSVDKIMNWEFTLPVPNLVHIHGSTDKIFPLRCVQPHHIIKGGGHLTVFNEGTQVSEILKQELIF